MIEHQTSIFDVADFNRSTETTPPESPTALPDFESHCPVCGAKLIAVKCKVVCRSETCVYRLIFNCSEF